MCKSSLSYDLELNVEGLLGITLDKKDIFLVNINESFQSDLAPALPAVEKQKRTGSEPIEIKGEEENMPSCAKKRRSRRRSRNSPGTYDVTSYEIGMLVARVHELHRRVKRTLSQNMAASRLLSI